jgi:hypothetical protein
MELTICDFVDLYFATPATIFYTLVYSKRVFKNSLCTWWLQYINYLDQSDYLVADRQGQGDTRLTLTPSVIPDSNYVIMVNDWNWLKYFWFFLYSNNQVHREFLIAPMYNCTRCLMLSLPWISYNKALIKYLNQRGIARNSRMRK